MSNIEKLFYEIDSKIIEQQNKSGKNYLQELANYLTLENDKQYFEIVDNYTKEEITKVYQFLILKSLQQLQDINYNITPEIIAFYISKIAYNIFGDKKLLISDLASGSGNILLGLSKQLNEESVFTSVEVDSDYVKLQQNIFNLIEKEIEIINQDALKRINIPLQDLVVVDTPYGYYTDEDNSLNFKLCSEEGYSLNSLLFLEQATSYIKKDGVAILIMPKKIMEFDNKIKKFLEQDINFNAFILLPEEMFKNKEQQKVIVLTTKKDQNILPQQIFLAEIPSYKNRELYLNFEDNFKKWLDSK